MFESFTPNTNSLSSSTRTLLDPSVSQSALKTSSELINPLQQDNRSISSSFSTTTPGVFTVNEAGKVSFDYLFDSGGYNGEVAIFDLDDMDRYFQVSVESFAREAALRALSNTDRGHTIISDQTEAARFKGSFPKDGNFGSGAYLGTKTFSMRPGAHFGIMLIPNGKVEDFAYNRNQKADQLPLFSISLANSNQAVQFAQLSISTSEPPSLNGAMFSFEDLRLDGQSDRDYNDLIFQVRGAVGSATLLDQVIDPKLDWRGSELGQAITSYAIPYTLPGTSEFGETVTADLISQITGKAKPLTTDEEKVTPSKIHNVFTSTEIKEWLDESKQQLVGLRSQSSIILSNVQNKITSATEDTSERLDLEMARFQLDSEGIQALLNRTRPELEVDKTQIMSLLQSAETTYREAISQANVEFENLRKSYDELRTGYEQLGGSSEDWAKEYRTLLESTQKEFDDIYNTGLQLDRSSRAQLDKNKDEFENLDRDIEELLTETQNRYRILRSDALIALRRIQNQYYSIEESWNQWLDDTGAKLEVWAKILTQGNQDNHSSGFSMQEGYPLIGVIDTGFAANDPDINYSRITSGKDWIEGDLDALGQNENGHGTQILKLIAATRNNGIGIDGINDRSPIWLGRAVGSSNWAQSLVEFVDAARKVNQTNAVVNLSFDLTQTNADGTITPRYKLTPLERAALTYAQQNHILIVAAAGNENSDLISAIGQAAQEFDNILVVGAAQGWERAGYSNYGNGIDILAQGTDGVTFGTSSATAKVTGAASLVWAANPHLNYRQVMNILRDTATDISIPNWDSGTGFGLLNIPAAVYLAKATEPEAYQSLSSILLGDMFRVLDAPEKDQQMLRELFYYVDLENKLTGETWNSANGEKATERASWLLEAIAVGGVIYGIIKGGSPDDSDVQKAQAERNAIGDKWKAEFDKDAANIRKIEEQAKKDIINLQNQIDEALKNGKSSEDIENLRQNLVQVQKKFDIDYAAAQQDLLQDQQKAAVEIAGADAQLEKARKQFESGNNIFTRLASKFTAPIQQIGYWFEQLPARVLRLTTSNFEILSNLAPRVWDGDWWKSFAQLKSYTQFWGRLGTFFVNVVELTPSVELLETALNFIKPNTRPLTDREIAIAKSVFGDSINYSLVRIDSSAFLAGLGAPRTTFHTINSLGPLEKKEDVNRRFDSDGDGVNDDVVRVPNEVLIHELTHVWQYEQNGAIYAPEALIAQIEKGRNEAYNYGGRRSLVEIDKAGNIKTDRGGYYYALNPSIITTTFFKDLNREQQGKFIQDYYHIRENDDPSIPGTIEDNKYLSVYARILGEAGNSPSTRPVYQLMREKQITVDQIKIE